MNHSINWHNDNATGSEASFVDKLQNHGGLKVTNPQGLEYAGPHTIAIERTPANGFTITITPKGSDTIAIPLGPRDLQSAGLTEAANYYIERAKKPDHDRDKSIDGEDVRNWFCKRAEPLIQDAFKPRIHDVGSTAYYLASRILDMEIGTRTRINNAASNDISRG